jgi:hypothetical protein
MNSKTLTWVVVAAVVVIGGIYLMTRSPGSTNNGDDKSAGAEGRVVFSVTDAAADMGTISEISMKVNKVDMHSSESGWVTVSSTPKTFDLLALNASGKSELLADVEVDEGVYDQVRLMVDSVVVETKAGASKTAKLPSGELKINATVVVERDSTASMNFDFLGDKSLHTTGSGEYIFAPVVKTESKSNAQITIGADGVVTIAGGNLESDGTAGMDIDGNVKLNFQLNSSQKLNIGSDNKIMIDTSGVLK